MNFLNFFKFWIWFSILEDLYIASTSSVPFKLAYMRVNHIRFGHNHKDSTLIEKLHSHKHPKNDEDFIYTVNIYKCNECGLVYYDNGMELRNGNVANWMKESQRNPG